MPTTEKITHRPEVRDDVPADKIPCKPRDPSTQELIDNTDELLDTIDEILDVEEVERQITLSDLIRGGSKKSKQCYNEYSQCNDEFTCALGAAMLEARDRGLM